MTHNSPSITDILNDIITSLSSINLETLKFAVGVSGGPDSMALCYALSEWANHNDNPAIYAVTVNHGLRSDAADEAQSVGSIVNQWPCIDHAILTWDGDKPDSRVQETARDIRYTLIKDFCLEQEITHFFLAHHQDDQAETVLFRLAKGSGIDGLSGMHTESVLSDTTNLVRPFLNIPKQDLIDYCEKHGITFVSDPTNDNLDHARPRLRQARDVLAEEGLTARRLAKTAMRIGRARNALDEISANCFHDSLTYQDDISVSLDSTKIERYPEEIILRIMVLAMEHANPDIQEGYGPRYEKIEDLAHAYLHERPFRKRTLGGCIIMLDDKKNRLILKKEIR